MTIRRSPRVLIALVSAVALAWGAVLTASVPTADARTLATLGDPDFIDIGLASNPYGVALSPDGSRAFVAANLPSQGRDLPRSKLTVIDTASRSIINEIPIPFQAWEVAVTPDGQRVLVTSILSGTVSIVDAWTGTLIREVPAGDQGAGPSDSVFGLALSPDGSIAYVALRTKKLIVTVDTASGSIIGLPIDITGGDPRFLGMPYDLVASPDGASLYVTTGYDSVVVIDTTSRLAIDRIRIPTATDTRGVAVTPDGRKLYVTDFEEHFVAVIDTGTRRVTRTIPTTDPGLVNHAFGPQNIVVSNDGDTAYVASYVSNKVVLIDTTTDQVRMTVPVPQPPRATIDSPAAGIAISPTEDAIYVTDYVDWLIVLRPLWAPDPPVTVVARAGDRQATITWKPPTYEGSDRVMSYTVRSEPGGASCMAFDELTCTIRGLRNSVSYRFTVTASNSAGTSVRSMPSNPVTPKAADSSTSVDARCSGVSRSGVVTINCMGTTKGIRGRSYLTPFVRYGDGSDMGPWVRLKRADSPMVDGTGFFFWSHKIRDRATVAQVYFRFGQYTSTTKTVAIRPTSR